MAKKKYGWGGKRDGQTGRKPALTVFQRMNIGEQAESRWYFLRTLKGARMGGSVIVNEEGEVLRHVNSPRPYGARDQVIADVIAWAAAERGLTLTKSLVVTSWVMHRASKRPKPARARRRAA